MSDRRRNVFVLLMVLGLLLASVALIATKKTRLGLDLKGGVQLVYQGKPTPQQPEVTAEALDRALQIVRERVDKLGVAEPEIQRSGEDQLEVGLPDVKNRQRAVEQVGTTAQLFFYDWEPNVLGADGKPHPDDATVTETPITQYEAVKRAAKRPPQRDGNNTVGDQYFLVDDKAAAVRAGPEDTEAELYADNPRLRTPKNKVVKVNEGTVIIANEKPEGGLPKGAKFDQWFVLNDDPALTGTDIRNPEQSFDQGPGGSGEPIVTMDFTKKGREAFHDVTRGIAQRGVQAQTPGEPAETAFQHFAISLDNELVSRPFINFQENPDGIDGRTGAQISGGFTIQTAQDLANFLKIGALPIKLELISQSQVSATLGKQALNEGLIAGAAGLAIVALFLLLFYRVLGAIAVLALGVYAVYFFALIKLIPITLTLPGIAGLILTIGVAADANIVIFERVKEEIRAGRSIPAGIAQGYKKGLSTIIDANVVTIMVAFILFILATAGVKGFAFTLGIGVIVSLFTAVLATQAILGTMGRSRILARPSALGAGKQRMNFRRLDYMGASKWFFSMSGVILLIGALAIGGKGLTFGIDFESGSRIRAPLERTADEDAVRAVMEAEGFPSAKIQRVEDDELGQNVFQISTPNLSPDQLDSIESSLEQRFGIRGQADTESIGPTFGSTVARLAAIAIVASLLVISMYIALRFEWKYAVPVLIALAHDILITSGVYALSDREVTTSTVAALLTVLGFSLYDTIIVFDRIRENVPRMPRAAFSQIVNRSMSEVLARSLATSFCSALPVLALLLFGGETLQDFAFALLIGTISGTYSSVFIAGPVLTHWKEREPVYRQRTQRIRREFGGVVPAYATSTDAPAEAPLPDRPLVSRRLTTPDEPSEISEDEFEELVRDLHADGEDGEERAPAREPVAARRASRTAAETALGRPAGDAEENGPPAPAGDLEAPAPAPRPAKPPKPKKPTGAGGKRRKHGRKR